MPISIVIVACGCLLIYFGILGFTEKGIPFSAKKRLNGPTGMIVGILCMICGAGLILLGAVFILLIALRSLPS
jgi:hypothetical protein